MHNVGTIPVPSGKTDEWDVFLIPNEIGFDESESNSNNDNALIKYTPSATLIKKESGWKVDAPCKYRFSTDPNHVTDLGSNVTCIIFRRALCLGD